MSERSTRLLFAVAASPFVILGALALSIRLSLLDERMSALVSAGTFLAGALLLFASKALIKLHHRRAKQVQPVRTPLLLACFRIGYVLMALAVLNSIGLLASTQYV